MPRGKVKPYPAVSFEDALEIGRTIQKIGAGEKVRRLEG